MFGKTRWRNGGWAVCSSSDYIMLLFFTSLGFIFSLPKVSKKVCLRFRKCLDEKQPYWEWGGKKKAEKQKNRTVLKLEYRLYRKVSSPNICITFKNPPAQPHTFPIILRTSSSLEKWHQKSRAVHKNMTWKCLRSQNLNAIKWAEFHGKPLCNQDQQFTPISKINNFHKNFHSYLNSMRLPVKRCNSRFKKK